MQAKGRLQCWNAEGQELGGSCREGFVVKGQAATLAAKAGGQRAWWQLRLECPNNRALCAGKGQAAMLEQQKLRARGLGGSCRHGIGGF